MFGQTDTVCLFYCATSFALFGRVRICAWEKLVSGLGLALRPTAAIYHYCKVYYYMWRLWASRVTTADQPRSDYNGTFACGKMGTTM
jgi:hypothetical protein